MLCCPLCRFSYDDARRIPMIGLCGHTICSTCRSNLVRRQCPVSLRCSLVKFSFLFPAVNYTLQELVELLKRRRCDVFECKQAYPTRCIKELKDNIMAEHSKEEHSNRCQIAALSETVDSLQKQLNDLEEKKKVFSTECNFNKGNAVYVKCTKCNEQMADWLAMCCFTCTEDVSKTKFTNSDFAKIRASQLCGNCIIESEHKHHRFDTIIAFEAQHRISMKLNKSLDNIKSLTWPYNEKGGTIHYNNLKRILADARFCKNMGDVDEIIANVQLGMKTVYQLHTKAWQNYNGMMTAKKCQAKEQFTYPTQKTKKSKSNRITKSKIKLNAKPKTR